MPPTQQLELPILISTDYLLLHFLGNTIAYWSNRKHRDAPGHFLFAVTKMHPHL